MSSHYRCLGCGHLFPRSDAYERQERSDHPTVDWDRSQHPVTVESCPHCGSDELEDVVVCSTCEEVEPEPGDDYCADCRAVEDMLDEVHADSAAARLL